MGIDVKKLKNRLTEQHIVTILSDLSATIETNDDKSIVFSSICHHLDAENHKKKLYYYKDSGNFYCYSCGNSFDVIGLIRQRWELQNLDFCFVDILNYIVDLVDINIDSVTRINPKVDTSDWKSIMSKYDRYESDIPDVQIFNVDVLKFFSECYPLAWLEEGYTVDIMRNFDICYYPLQNATIIPVYDEQKQLVGMRQRCWNPSDLELGRKYVPVRLLNNEQFNFPTSQYFYGEWCVFSAIRKHKKCVLVESEKSVILSSQWFGRDSFTLGLFGKNMSKMKRNKLLSLGVEEIIIGIDYDYTKIDLDKPSPEFLKYQTNVMKIARMFNGYCTVSVLVSYNGHNEKDSPFDNGIKFYNNLWSNRERIEVNG